MPSSINLEMCVYGVLQGRGARGGKRPQRWVMLIRLKEALNVSFLECAVLYELGDVCLWGQGTPGGAQVFSWICSCL